jgi:hypothetical protein
MNCSKDISEDCLSRTWTLEALRGLATVHLGRSKRSHLKSKKEFLTYLISLYTSLCCSEYDLVTCSANCQPLRHRSTVDDRRLSRHRAQKIHIDYFSGCFLTDLDMSTCLTRIRTLVPEGHELDQVIALPCYVATRIPSTFAPPSSILGESLDNNGTAITPLGIVIDPVSNNILGIVTSEGILRLLAPYQDHSRYSTLPTLQASRELVTELLDGEDGLLPDQTDYVLGLIRSHGTVVTDQGRHTMAVLWWQHLDIPDSYPIFLDIADHVVLSAKTTRPL